MDAVDPLCAVSSTTCLLRRTLGGPAPAASPSKADEALLRSISATLKGSKELIEQSKIVMKEYGDIRMVYPDDGGKVSAAVNCKINQLGRHVAIERKRHRFSMKYPAMLSKALPVVDRSVLHTISDPDEYFAKEAELDKTETEIKRLNGEIQLKRTLNFDPINEPKRRNSSRPRKSYFFSSYAHATSATMIPVSQSENVTESQTSQDDAHASVSEKNEQSVPSRYDKCAISDSLMEEDSFNEKDESDDITDIMGAFQEYEGPDKVDFLRKKIGIGEIPMEKIYRDSVPLGSTARTNLQEARTLEGPLSVSHQARVSELEKHIFRDTAMDKDKDLSKDDGFEGHTQERPLPGSRQALVSELTERIFRDAAMDKHTDVLKDDEFEGSPEIMMREQSLAHDSSDVDLTTDEIFSARGKDREAPSPSVKSSENIIDPELNVPDRATIDNNPCSRHDISNEEDNMPTDYSTTDKSNNEALVSSHPLEDTSTEVLANTPGRNVAPDDIARTSHSSEDNIQHEEVVEEDGVVQDTSVHSLEIPLEDIGLQNQSQAPDGTIKELTADLRNAPSPTKEKTKQAAKQGKTKQQPKRGKKVADKSVHSLEMPLEDIGLQNQSQAPDGTIKELTADLRNAPSPTKEKTKKATKQGKTKQQPKRGKKVADNSVHSLEMPLEDIGLQNQSQAPDGTIKELTADLRNAPSPTKEKTEKAAKQGKSKQQPKRGKKVADESHHSLETPQADFDSENQPHTDDANTEKLIADVRALSPPKEKTQIATQRGKNKQQPKRGKKVADESHHSLEIPQSDLDTENQPHTHDVNSEQQTVVMRDVLSPNKPKGQKEAKRRNRAQELNRKKRLADADLEWQSGVRRSTRIRYRPLDQWRGERFIYGRIHETITVIGVKSYSPGKDGKAALKVKSFVPEQYSDIVAKGAKVLA